MKMRKNEEVRVREKWEERNKNATLPSDDFCEFEKKDVPRLNIVEGWEIDEILIHNILAFEVLCESEARL